MSLPFIIIIMLLTGIAGGFINYLLPSNTGTDGKTLRNPWACIALGIGATILVPLFLEIAQSKLLDNIHSGWMMEKANCINSNVNTGTPKTDTTKKDSTIAVGQNKDTLNVKVTTVSKAPVTAEPCVPLKNYFLYAAYCFLAAAAGFRFINGLIDSVLKDKQIADLKEKNSKTEAAKDEVEKIKNKLDAQNKLEQAKEEKQTLHEVAKSASLAAKPPALIKPVLGPIVHRDDPQKGRFGGQATNNGRQLKADVKAALIKGYYNVTVWVESLDKDKPLTDEVIFYLHDSFRPSVYTIAPGEFKDGKAIDDDIIAWGAFTVGAIADNGDTLLELDLSEDARFPEKFRER